jgi:hypothetical protein
VGGPERERELFVCPITTQKHVLFMGVGLLKFYEEFTSLKGNSSVLQQLIHHWDHDRYAFKVSPNKWYQPMEKDVYFITKLSRRQKVWP